MDNSRASNYRVIFSLIAFFMPFLFVNLFFFSCYLFPAEKSKGLLPIQDGNHSHDCKMSGNNHKCFKSGDDRFLFFLFIFLQSKKKIFVFELVRSSSIN